MSKYSLREQFTVNGKYNIVLDRQGYNEPILLWNDSCKSKNTKKVEKLRAEGKYRLNICKEADKPKYSYKEVK